METSTVMLSELNFARFLKMHKGTCSATHLLHKTHERLKYWILPENELSSAFSKEPEYENTKLA